MFLSKNKFSFILCFCIALNLVFAPLIKAEPVNLPAEVQTVMLTGLYSERSEIGDDVELELMEPINLYNERVFIPISSVFVGKVVDIEESGRGLQRGKIRVLLNRILYPNGYILGTKAYIVDEKKSLFNFNEQPGELSGNADWKQKLWRAGKIGAGTLLGGPIGAAAATGVVIFDKGGKLRIRPGDPLKVNVERISFVPQNTSVSGRVQGKDNE
ncbi:MAG TPA: hypothetical protein V6C96_02190, partial [Vampirovibrionales bacterium]